MMTPKPHLAIEQVRRKKKPRVTVCVAAMCRDGRDRWIVAAADRMVTTGDIEFEQEQRKIQQLTTSISIMVAGDLSVQAEIINRLIGWKNAKIEVLPEQWLNVKEVADEFYKYLIDLKREKARQSILEPLNLDYEKLVSGAVSNELALQLSKEIFDFQLVTIEVIVMGMDSSGMHMYTVNNQGVSCQDWTGFAAIGGGSWHANSQLTYASHTKNNGLAETLMLVYTSKRRAEVAPGVGAQTDMVAIGPNLGESTVVGDPLMDVLRATYKEASDQAERVRRDANAKIDQFFQAAIAEEALHSENHSQSQIGAGDIDGNQEHEPQEDSGEEIMH